MQRFVVYRNRFYDKTSGKMVPRAHQVWLKYNPAFKEIPKDYVIHHLDGDSTNDDPSNLVLMRYQLHSAHHFKNNRVQQIVEEVNVRDPDMLYIPIKDIKVSRYVRYRNKWHIYYWGENEEGETKQVRIYSDRDGTPFSSEEIAKQYADELSMIFNVQVRVSAEQPKERQKRRKQELSC